MEKSVINTVLIIIPVLIVIILAVLILNNVSLTGHVVEENQVTTTQTQEQVTPRHIFYNVPLVYPNPEYSESCFPAGEVMSVLPDNKCCDGLEMLPITDDAQLPDCQFITGGALCSDCGNQQCDFGENNCNCPEDCNLPTTTQQ